MRIYVMYFLLYNLCITISTLNAARVVDFSYTSLGSPDFYLGDDVTFTCTASGFSNITILDLVYNDTETGSSGSYYDEADDKWKTISGTNTDIFNGPYGHAFITDLNRIYINGNVEGFNMNVSVRITDVSVRGRFFCRVFEGRDYLSNQEAVVSYVKVQPWDLKMSISPEDVAEGDQFRVGCESTRGIPRSTFKYEIVRGNTVVGNDSTYTITKNDTRGITAICKDTAHPNWKGRQGRNTVTSRTILPNYIEAVRGTNFPLIIYDPKILKHQLRCDDVVTGKPKPYDFTWMREGAYLRGKSSILTFFSKSDGTKESITCIASNGLEKAIVITWNIRWDSSAYSLYTTPNDQLTEVSEHTEVS